MGVINTMFQFMYVYTSVEGIMYTLVLVCSLLMLCFAYCLWLLEDG